MSTPNASATATTTAQNGSSSHTNPTPTTVTAPTKSSGDDRSYRHLVLSNGLSVLLVSDAETDKASAAMDVGVGSWSDPDELPGLAHFLEHMVRHTATAAHLT